MHSGKNRLVMYQQLKEGILHDISSGRLGAGAKLPSERELCRAYSVSRVTVRRAILDLVSEGILETVPGKGTYVRGLRQGKNATGYIAFVRCVRAARASSITDDVFYPAILAGLEAAAAAR
ncbi:MAG: GntR family transcriptional regulator, partial [Bacillota bacterium]